MTEPAGNPRPLDPKVARNRETRKRILRLLFNTWSENPDVSVLYDDIIEGFVSGRVQYDAVEIQAQICDLAEDGMLTVEDVPGWRELRKGCRITGRGRDFALANYPWEKVDEFTGGQRA